MEIKKDAGNRILIHLRKSLLASFFFYSIPICARCQKTYTQRFRGHRIVFSPAFEALATMRDLRRKRKQLQSKLYKMITEKRIDTKQTG